MFQLKILVMPPKKAAEHVFPDPIGRTRPTRSSITTASERHNDCDSQTQLGSLATSIDPTYISPLPTTDSSYGHSTAGAFLSATSTGRRDRDRSLHSNIPSSTSSINVTSPHDPEGHLPSEHGAAAFLPSYRAHHLPPATARLEYDENGIPRPSTVLPIQATATELDEMARIGTTIRPRYGAHPLQELVARDQWTGKWHGSDSHLARAPGMAPSHNRTSSVHIFI